MSDQMTIYWELLLSQTQTNCYLPAKLSELLGSLDYLTFHILHT